MQKQIKILLTLLTVLILAISCASPNDPTNTNWKDNTNHDLLKKSWYDTASTDSTYNYDGTTFSSSWQGTVSYSFTVEEIVWGSDNTSGIIYGKYTANTTYPELVGKYYAVSFKDLTSESVSIAGAYKAEGGVSATDTLEEAKTTFTEANGYFNQYSACKVYIITSNIKTVYYGSKSAEVDINDQAKLKELWVALVANQFVYNQWDYKSGQFDAEGNYHDIGGTTGNDYENPKPEVRTQYLKNVTYEYNGKLYLAGIYWDNENPGMPSAYRLIIIDDTGAEQGWYGGGTDETVIPDESTQWTKYDFVLGYLKTY